MDPIVGHARLLLAAKRRIRETYKVADDAKSVLIYRMHNAGYPTVTVDGVKLEIVHRVHPGSPSARKQRRKIAASVGALHCDAFDLSIKYPRRQKVAA